MTLNDIKNPAVKEWLKSWVDLCTPDSVVICDGSQKEYNTIANQLVKAGVFIKLDEKKKPNSYAARSDVRDVARVEGRTFICSKREIDAGPTNHWMAPAKMKKVLCDKKSGLFSGCMKGRTMYIIPFSMGPVESPISKYGIEITDSGYVVCNMHIMTRVSAKILAKIEKGAEFVKCVHSVGAPLEAGQPDSCWPCNPDNRYITHFPETREIISFGSGYGGNALLGKKCFALRIATVQARDEGWLAEHMLILKLTSPKKEVKYVAAAFPSACGKTNLAMMKPTLPGWKVETIGDDIAWMKFNAKDGMLHAINPENGFFGVAPGTGMKSNPNAMLTVNKGNSIFTNVALTDDGDVYWKDMDKVPEECSDWIRRRWHKGDKGADGKAVNAAHPNSRFTTPAKQCPVIAKEWEDPAGVPISAFLFGGRRAGVVPLVNEALSWEHGVFLGSTVASEKTAAADGKVGELRFDPFAMLPFCGYNMGDYFSHWLEIGKKAGAKLPKIYYVNWFRKDPADGHFLWNGYGDNSRVLKWVFERCNGTAKAVETEIGFLPTVDSIDFKGLKMSDADKKALLSVDKKGWQDVIPQIKEHYAKFGKKLPKVLAKQLEALEKRLGK